MFKFALVLIFVAVFVGCGDGIEVTPGPKLTKILGDHDRKMIQRNALDQISLEAAKCGFESTDANLLKNILTSESAFRLGYETVGTDSKEQAVSISSDSKVQVFNLKNLKASLEQGSPFAQEILVAGKKAMLTPHISAKTSAPIVIRSKCLVLNENESIETNGRDLYIISDKVVLNGSIRTTPQSIDDEPGKFAGAIRIYSAVSEFGPKALLDVRGGNAGTIKMLPGDLVTDAHPRNREQMISEVTERMTDLSPEAETKELGMPENSLEDAAALFYGWTKILGKEENISSFVFDPFAFELLIYSDGNPASKLSAVARQIAGNNRPTSHRNEIIAANKELLINAWKKWIENAPEHFKIARDIAPSVAFPSALWLYQSHLYAQIRYLDRKRSLKPDLRSNVFSIDLVAFADLPGGAAGQIQILSPIQEGKPKYLDQSGQGSNAISPKWILPPNQQIQIPGTTRKRDVRFFVRDRNSGQTHELPSYESPETVIDTLQIIPQIKTGAAILKAHPHQTHWVNRERENHSIDIPAREIMEAFEKWGIAAEAPKTERAIIAIEHPETLEAQQKKSR